MEFELNKTQKDIQKAVRDFVKGEFGKELAYELEKKHEFHSIPPVNRLKVCVMRYL